MDPEENYALTQALVGGGENGTSPADISMGSHDHQNNTSTKCCSRIRNLPTLFFIMAPMIIFIAVLFISTALIPATYPSSKQATSLRESMINYLTENMMPYDAHNRLSLGFPTPNHQSKVDGLSDGIVNQTVYYSIQAKTLYPWTDSIPDDVYMEYVVPFAVVTEPRTDHRPLFFDTLKDSLKQYERSSIGNNTQSTQEQIKDVVKLINTRLWALMGRDSEKPIVFKASQTPRIYDPLSVIAYGYSSCTGLAIMLVSALRSVGIPARMAGTPAWYGDPSKGDHSWVEVYVVSNETDKGGQWIFLEPTPGIAEGKEDTANADNLDRDPCKRWFCKADRFNGSTKVYATRYDKQATTFFPMAWAEGDEGVPGEDRTNYYIRACGKCK